MFFASVSYVMISSSVRDACILLIYLRGNINCFLYVFSIPDYTCGTKLKSQQEPFFKILITNMLSVCSIIKHNSFTS